MSEGIPKILTDFRYRQLGPLGLVRAICRAQADSASTFFGSNYKIDKPADVAEP